MQVDPPSECSFSMPRLGMEGAEGGCPQGHPHVPPGAGVSQDVPVSWGMAPLRVLGSQMLPEMQLFIESLNGLGWKGP